MSVAIYLDILDKDDRHYAHAGEYIEENVPRRRPRRCGEMAFLGILRDAIRNPLVVLQESPAPDSRRGPLKT